MESIPRVYPCNTCSITFETSALQRSHMRQAWHIYNLRRRVAQLPVTSEKEYDTQAREQDGVHQKTNHDREREPGRERRSSPNNVPTERRASPEESLEADSAASARKNPPTQCLFCKLSSPDLPANMAHMSAVHGLFIPSPRRLWDLESFLGYLATIIFAYNECLYCGQSKGSVAGVQTHMRDKGHCMIQLATDSELLDFWALSDSETESEREDGEESAARPAVRLSDTEMRLPSGHVINARASTTQFRVKPGIAHAKRKGEVQRRKRAEGKAIAAAEEPEREESERRPTRSSDNRVALRSEMGLVGVPESQRRALQIAEKKMQRRDAIAKTAYRHAMEQQPVKAMYYKTENPVYQAG